MSGEALVSEIATALNTSLFKQPRLRVAVTPAEFLEIREYMLDKYGEFYARILNIPLVVQSDAIEPELKMEIRNG